MGGRIGFNVMERADGRRETSSLDPSFEKFIGGGDGAVVPFEDVFAIIPCFWAASFWSRGGKFLLLARKKRHPSSKILCLMLQSSDN